MKNNLIIWNNNYQQTIKLQKNLTIGKIQATGTARQFGLIKDRAWKANVLTIQNDTLMTSYDETIKKENQLIIKAKEQKLSSKKNKLVNFSFGEKFGDLNGFSIGSPISNSF